MRITADTLPAIEADETTFADFFVGFTTALMRDACLYPLMSRQRLVAAHGAWKADIKRIVDHEQHLSEGLDHFKRAGHLTYWVRRMSPIIDGHDPSYNLQDSDSHQIVPNQVELEMRESMFGFWNEYVAFELGFQLCKFYELGQRGARRRGEFYPSAEYYRTMCQFLRFKNVSPHALYLIYKSLFVA